MATGTAETSPLVRARVAGFLYLIANLFAPFTLLYLPPVLFCAEMPPGHPLHSVSASCEGLLKQFEGDPQRASVRNHLRS